MSPWWVKTDAINDENERACAVIAEAASIEQYQRSWHELNLWNATLFSNRTLTGFNWGGTEVSARELWPFNLNTENLIREIGQAKVSKACSSPLKPTLVPHGNSWKTERAVRLLDNFQFGVWRQTNAEDACVRAFILDGFISGLGCVHVDFDPFRGTLSVNPVFFDSIIIDNRECVNRQSPRTVRIRRVLPTASIEAAYGRLVMEKQRYIDYREVGDGWDVVVEAWRLPDANGKGGRHVKACRGRLLLDRPWKDDWFPTVFMHYSEPLSGFFTPGGVEPLVPYQTRQNELNEAIRVAQDVVARPRMKIHANAQINLDQWDNEAGRFVTWSGSEPQPLVWPSNLQELYNERERNRAQAFVADGMSEAFAGAQPPDGIRFDSSAGLREFRNMEDSRHLRLWSKFEAARLEVAKTMLRVLGQHPEADEFRSIFRPARATQKSKTIAFKAVRHLTENDYSWTMDAASLSQQSPAARRETLRSMVAEGKINDSQASLMMLNPNLELQDSVEIAGKDDIARHIEIMLDGGFEAPSEVTFLSYGIERVTASVHQLRCYDDVDPEVIDNHLKWLVLAANLQLNALPQPTAAAPEGPIDVPPETVSPEIPAVPPGPVGPGLG